VAGYLDFALRDFRPDHRRQIQMAVNTMAGVCDVLFCDCGKQFLADVTELDMISGSPEDGSVVTVAERIAV